MTESSKVSRRHFLWQTASAVGAALVAPTFVPASALGRNGATPPSERITMGFIGVCDVWRDRRERACQKVNDHYAEVSGQGSYKACMAYTDFRQVLARPDIDRKSTRLNS